MLAVIPCSLTGRMSAVLSALIAIASLIGLTMHRDFYAGRRRKDYFCFYTNLSNLLVLGYFALVAPRLHAAASLHPLIAHADFLITMSILLTLCVFHFLLFPAVRTRVARMPRTRGYRIAYADNLIQHYIVPLLVLIYWLLCSRGKETLMPLDALLWTVVPLLYLSYIFLRAKSGRIIEEAGSPYPYPFLDVAALGARRVAYVCLRLYALCLYVGISVIALTRTACFLSARLL